MGIFTFPGTLDTVVGDPAGVFAPDLAPYALLAGATFSGVARVPAGTAALPGLAVGAVTAGASSGGATTTEYLALSSNGIEFLRGVGNAASTSLVTLTGSATTTSLLLQNNTTDVTQQTTRFAQRHYTAAEEPMALLYATNDGTSNILSVGGGTAALNSVSILKLFAAATATTVTGTEMVRMTPSGFRLQAGISGSPSYLLQVATTADSLGLCVSDSLGTVGMGVAPISGTKLAVVQASGTQLRLGYDSSNYQAVAVSVAGRMDITGTGTSSTVSIRNAGVSLNGMTSHFSLNDATAVGLGNGGGLGLFGIVSGSYVALAGVKAYKATATEGETGAHLDAYSRANGGNAVANLRVGTEGRVLIQAGITTQVADTRLHVVGAAATTLGVLTLEQLDDDEPFIVLEGTSAASAAKSLSTWTVPGAVYGYARVEIAGVGDKWIALYEAPTA